MAHVRSPNYPSLSLPEAIERIQKIHGKEQHLAAPREVIAKHLGYGGLNGASNKILSALGKYGLMEDVGKDKVRVSPLAVSILHPVKESEKPAAIREAAFKPALFQEIASEWEGAQPSDANLRAYLIRRNFAADALDRVIQSYRETMELVARAQGTYDSPTEADRPPPAQEPAAMHSAPASISPAAPPTGGDPFRLVFSPSGGLEGGFRLNSADELQGLVRALEGMSFIFKKADEIKPRDDTNG